MNQYRLDGIVPDRVAVLMVDFQNQFCHPDACEGPAVTNANNAAAAARAQRFATQASAAGAQVIYTRQVCDPSTSTPRQRRWDEALGLCPEGSWEAELFVEPIERSIVVVKPRFDVWQSPAFLAYLATDPVDAFIIAGVELRCRVLYAALGADERGFNVVVPQDLVSGLDAGDGTSNRLARALLTDLFDAPSTADGLLMTLRGTRRS